MELNNVPMNFFNENMYSSLSNDLKKFNGSNKIKI